MLLDCLLTFSIGALFGFLLLKLKVPGAMMVGSIVSVSILSIFFGAAYMPAYAKTAAQIVAGAFIGCSIDKEELMEMRHIYKPAAVLLLSMLILNLVMGVIVYAYSPMDLLTSLLCTVPGGVSEMPLIAEDMGADSAKIAVVQFFRMLAGVGVFPGLIALMSKKPPTPAPTPHADAKNHSTDWKHLAIILATAAVSGIIGRAIRFPSGSLLFPLITIIILKFFGVATVMPRWIRRLTQVLAGAYIGSSVTYGDILELRMLALPTLLIITGYFINSLVTGRILSKHFGLSPAEGMLAVNPAGASDMALISADLGVRNPNVNVLQIIRMLSAVTIFPQVMRVVALIFS